MDRSTLTAGLREVANEWTPPDALRPQVLGAAAPLVRPAATWSDRVWFSWRWRFAVAAVVVAILALDVASARPGGRASLPPSAVACETAQAIDEAARQAGLPPEQARGFASRALALASRPDPDARAGSLALVQKGEAR